MHTFTVTSRLFAQMRTKVFVSALLIMVWPRITRSDHSITQYQNTVSAHYTCFTRYDQVFALLVIVWTRIIRRNPTITQYQNTVSAHCTCFTRYDPVFALLLIVWTRIIRSNPSITQYQNPFSKKVSPGMTRHCSNIRQKIWFHSPCLFRSHLATTPSNPGISLSSGQIVQM